MKLKAQLKGGLWPESREPAPHHIGFTVAAKRLAEATLEELSRLGVIVTLEDGRARFRAAKVLPPAAKRVIETHADLIESFLKERQKQ